MTNIQKIDNDIYVKLAESHPNARTIQEAKEAIRRGETREYIGNILARILWWQIFYTYTIDQDEVIASC
jgi:hypothetical protein